MFNNQHTILKQFLFQQNVVGVSIKVCSRVNTSADLKPELSMILEAFTLSSNPPTHEQPQLNSQDYPLQMR